MKKYFIVGLICLLLGIGIWHFMKSRDQVTDDGKCQYDKKIYSQGQKFPAKDSCNTCTCSNDGIHCTEIHCPR